MKLLKLNKGWTITEMDYTNEDPDEFIFNPVDGKSYPAAVPGDIHHDLMKAGVIEDPYYSDNSLKCKWVTQKDWCYYNEFELPDGFIDEQVKLVLSGIDTYSVIYLNGKKIGTTNNAFRKYEFDIKDLIGRKNTLVIRLKSTRKEAEKFPVDGYFGCFNVERIFIRKPQCHFSWDWAPNFPAFGITDEVSIVSKGSCTIKDVNVRADIDGDVTFFVILDRRIDRLKEKAGMAEQRAFLGRRDEESKDDRFLVIVSHEETRIEKEFPVQGHKNFFSLRIDNPKLWWPNGYGEQPLYNYSVYLLRNGTQIDVCHGYFGIRKVDIEQKPRKDGGLTYKIKINDRYIFAKGANWVPLDMMTGVIPDDKYRQAIDMAKKAHFNIFRVWGGGMYEKDIFYELCDRNGIMIWQDFMFSNADIPDNHPWFVDHIIPEIEYQVTRLRNHPCIVIWCGGNEKTGSYGELKSYGDRTSRYLLRGIAGHLDSTRPYTPSSPFSYTDSGNDRNSGDSHCNSYQPCLKTGEVENFRKQLAGYNTSFASEIAVQGSSRLKSLKNFIPADKLWPINDIWDLHFTRNPYDGIGTTFLQQQQQSAERLFGEIKGLEDFVKKSMTMHYEFIRAEAEYYRSNKNECGAAMFWMFSDIWPCGTWAMIDYYMEPKPAYYAAKKAFEPFRPIITQKSKGIVLSVVNDTMSEQEADLVYGQKKLDGQIIWQKEYKQTVCENCVVEVDLMPYESAEDSYLFCSMKNGINTTFFPGLWRDVQWPEPGLKVSVDYIINNNGTYEASLRIKSDKYARMVKIDVNNTDAEFSDNFFDIEAREEKRVVIKSGRSFSAEDIRISHWLSEWTD